MNYVIINSYFHKENNAINLLADSWDDYGFKTTFNVSYVDGSGREKSLGTIKIGLNNEMRDYSVKDELPQRFDKLPQNAFSLWQSAEDYERVYQLKLFNGINVFEDLNDIAYNTDLFEKYRRVPVLQDSLMRSINKITVTEQYHRISLGQSKLTPFNFSYEVNNEKDPVRLDFDVVPNSCPPSNIHVLIGGNGVGKSTLIKNMIISIFDSEKNKSTGRFIYNEVYSRLRESEHFANVICVGFSPFDDYSDVEIYGGKTDSFTYIGTRKEYDSDGYEDGFGAINLLEDIQGQFLSSLKNCLSNHTKKEDLVEVLQLLENDPMFYEYNLSEMFLNNDFKIDYNDLSPYEKIFSIMSSGHKVVLSIIVRCIDKMAEKTIIFLDEPENHLHPPLVSSLVRSISFVLMKRNGVAIISTHSPIVLQETPKSCVWLLSRHGNLLNASRPRFETFGENIGTLTNDVFRYEINNSGFHALLKQSVRKLESYEDVLEEYDYQLGDEARGLIRVMFEQKKRDEL